MKQSGAFDTVCACAAAGAGAAAVSGHAEAECATQCAHPLSTDERVHQVRAAQAGVGVLGEHAA